VGQYRNDWEAYLVTDELEVFTQLLEAANKLITSLREPVRLRPVEVLVNYVFRQQVTYEELESVVAVPLLDRLYVVTPLNLRPVRLGIVTKIRGH